VLWHIASENVAGQAIFLFNIENVNYSIEKYQAILLTTLSTSLEAYN